MAFSIKKRSIIKRKVLTVLSRIQDYLLNSNNANIKTNGEYHFIKEYIESLKKDTRYNFFDIGANKGEYTEMLLELSSKNKLDFRVHIFEPVEYTFNNLKKNIPESIHTFFNKFGVSNEVGCLDIFYDNVGSPLASLYQRDVAEYNIVLDQKEKIDLIRLDGYIQDEDITHIHLLKIDVEGHEISAFEGMGEYLNHSFVDIVQFEYGGANIDSRTFLKDFFILFETRGFQMYKINRDCLVPIRYSASLENFKHANYLAISKNIV